MTTVGIGFLGCMCHTRTRLHDAAFIKESST
jgi:hypothetical protein